jgi:hypothetical protein
VSHGSNSDTITDGDSGTYTYRNSGTNADTCCADANTHANHCAANSHSGSCDTNAGSGYSDTGSSYAHSSSSDSNASSAAFRNERELHFA